MSQFTRRQTLKTTLAAGLAYLRSKGRRAASWGPTMQYVLAVVGPCTRGVDDDLRQILSIKGFQLQPSATRDPVVAR